MTGGGGLGVYGRAIGLTLGIGVLAGSVAGALVAVLMTWGQADMYGAAPASAVFGAMYGAGVGGLAGWVIGLPVVLVTALFRQHVACWRELGAVSAGVYVVAAPGAMAGWSSAVLVGALAVGLLAAACAWWGLGHVFAPAPSARRADDDVTLSP
jgi:hypothetical protein